MPTTGVALAALCTWVACGSGTPSAPIADGASPPLAAASPSSAPSATPAPSPEATPTPVPSPAGVNDNDALVDHIGVGVYYVDCNGEILPDSRGAKEVAVGCRVHLDATPKDADNIPTNPRYPVVWWFSAPAAIQVAGPNPLGPIITAKVPHQQKINVKVDGVESDTFSITFY